MAFGNNNMKAARWLTRLVFLFLASALAPWLTGCDTVQDYTLTGHMWEATAGNHREPAANANLRLYHTTDQKDVLVRYDEELESNGAIKPRAFLLSANERKLLAGLRPAFISAKKAVQMESVPIPIVSEFDRDALAKDDLQASISSDGRQFSLASRGRCIGTYNLPTYGVVTPRCFVARALFLPATVAGDVTVYSAAVGVVAGTIYAYGMASSSR